MVRITASLDDAQYDHVEALADEMDVSLAEVMRRLIDAHRRGDVDSDALVHHDASSDSLADAQLIHDRLDDLETRVDQLERDDVEPRTREVSLSEREPQGSVDGDDQLLAGWDPDKEINAQRAREEAQRAAEWLRLDGGRKKRSDFVDALHEESPLGERAFWERAVQPGLRKLVEQGRVEYRPGYHDYKWIDKA